MRLSHVFSAAKDKKSSTMGLLKILSSFQAKSLTIMVAIFFFVLNEFWSSWSNFWKFSHFTQWRMCIVKSFTSAIYAIYNLRRACLVMTLRGQKPCILFNSNKVITWFFDGPEKTTISKLLMTHFPYAVKQPKRPWSSTHHEGTVFTFCYCNQKIRLNN